MYCSVQDWRKGGQGGWRDLTGGAEHPSRCTAFQGHTRLFPINGLKVCVCSGVEGVVDDKQGGDEQDDNQGEELIGEGKPSRLLTIDPPGCKMNAR